MRLIKIISAAFLMLLGVTFNSCNKNKDDATPSQSVTTLPSAAKQKAYEKRWIIAESKAQRVTGEISTLIAIEFSSNSYVLFFPGDSTITGTFIQINDQTLELSDLGTLTINSISDDAFGFTLVSPLFNTSFVSAAAAKVIADSEFTNGICKKWKIVKVVSSINGEEGVIEDIGDAAYVTFSKYGTYLVTNKYGGVTDIATNTWMWTDAAESSFCYGAWDGSNISSCNGLGTVSVSFSDNYSKSTMIENYTYDGIDYKDQYDLVAE